MALIRITKRVVIVLCCGGIVLLGISLMKGGRPAGSNGIPPVEEAIPEVRVLTVRDPEEIVELRDRNTRVYRIVRDVEVTDPATDEVRIEQVESRIVEKANNLCYRDASGNFVPSVAEFEPVQGGFIADRNNFTVSAGLRLGDGLSLAFEGVPVQIRPAHLLLFDGVNAVAIGEANPDAVGQFDPENPSILRFPGVFGGVADLEYVLERGGYHQNIILKERAALPVGLNPGRTELLVYSEISYDDLVGNHRVEVSDSLGRVDIRSPSTASEPLKGELRFAVEDELRAESLLLFSFGESMVYEMQEPTPRPGEEREATKQLFRDNNGRTYLVERILHAEIANLRYPLVFDYVVGVPGSMTTDETWTPENTYHVVDQVTVSGCTLTIAPGTTVKFRKGAPSGANRIYVGAGAKIIVEGEPYNYVTFTSDEDDSSGEDLTPGRTGTPAQGDYYAAIYLSSTSSTSSTVKYCKFGYGTFGVVALLNQTGLAPIENNVFYKSSIYMQYSVPECKNNLVSNYSGRGIEVKPDGCTAKLHNNTVDNCGTGVYIYNLSAGASVEAKDNLLTRCTYGFYNGGTSGTVTLDYNGYWNNGTDRYNCSTGTHDVDAADGLTDPYASSAIGNYYLNTNPTGGSLLADAGSRTASAAGLASVDFGYVAPLEYSSGSINQNTIWSNVATDSGQVAIGYHHSSVDVVINNFTLSVDYGYTLTINAGVCVALKGGSSYLSVAGRLVCNGNPHGDGYTVITNSKAASMLLESPRAPDSGAGRVTIHPASPSDTQLTYTKCRWLNEFNVWKSLTGGVTHNMFELCYKGVDSDTCTYKNNVFARNYYGLLSLGGDTVTLSLNTFDQNTYGLYYQRYSGKTLTVMDCLFSRNDYGICLTSSGATFTHDYEGFFNNWRNIWDWPARAAIAIGVHSLVVADPPFATGTSWTKRYCLNQTSPVVDGGSDTAANLGMATFTTDKDDADGASRPDKGTVDIGYHYPLAAADPGWTNYSITNQYFNRTQTSATINLTYTAGSGDWTLTIIIPGGQNKVYTGSSNPVSQSWTGIDGDGNPVSDGTYSFTLERSGTKKISGFLVVDTTNPNILTIDHPASGDTVRGH